MTLEIEQLGYEKKSSVYFQYPRPEMMPFVPVESRRVLEVGCAEGAFGASLKKIRGIEVWGVEPTKAAAMAAAEKLDKVIPGFFGPETGLPAGSFDCILFNDVLEHMFSPDMALRYARTLLSPGGVVVASIPNIRSLPTLWQLVFHGRWEYQDSGVLDRTHLRFFTKSSIMQLFRSEGFDLESVCGINAYAGAGRRMWLPFRLTNALSFGRFNDMKFQQFAVVARPVG
jgi:2-polyprenyl-3-methyl-5-hydroxy-6-metoxy-1,4-benzoquinol methylase